MSLAKFVRLEPIEGEHDKVIVVYQHACQVVGWNEEGTIAFHLGYGNATCFPFACGCHVEVPKDEWAREQQGYKVWQRISREERA